MISLSARTVGEDHFQRSTSMLNKVLILVSSMVPRNHYRMALYQFRYLDGVMTGATRSWWDFKISSHVLLSRIFKLVLSFRINIYYEKTVL